MGCCNKKREESPLGYGRYLAGLILLSGFLLGCFALLLVLSLLVPRYRKVLPFYAEYARETLGSVARRARIRLQWRPGRRPSAMGGPGAWTGP